MSQLVQFMRMHVHDAWFDVDTTRDRVPPPAHQAQRRLHWACPVGLCDACCAGWVGGVSCTGVHLLGQRWLTCQHWVEQMCQHWSM